MQRRRHGDEPQRRQLAEDAARIMAEEGIDSHLDARTLAVRRRFGNHRPPLPDLAEIDEALSAYLRLFQADRHPQRLARMRATALAAMRLCAPFSTRLAGSVLNGNAVDGARIELHLLDCTLEEVAIHLIEQRVPYRIGERHLRFGRGVPAEQPMLMIALDGIDIQLVIFQPDGPRHAPRDPLTGGHMHRAPRAAVEHLLEDIEG